MLLAFDTTEGPKERKLWGKTEKSRKRSRKQECKSGIDRAETEWRGRRNSRYYRTEAQ
jgi:hypothetical protein